MLNFDIGGILGGIGSAAKDIRQAITGEISAEKKAELAVRAQEMENAVLLAQSEINRAEAASPKLFVAGWRPFIGWVCGISLAYEFVMKPIVEGAVMIVSERTDFMLPDADLAQLLPLVIAMLGLGVYRTVEKINGAQGRH